MKKLILWLLPKRFNGITLFGTVYSRGKLNNADWQHELVHVEQQRKEPLTFYFKYNFSKQWRLEYEAEAYATSIKYGRDEVDCILALANNYNLKSSTVEVSERIDYYVQRESV